jgi:hypothetical protein
MEWDGCLASFQSWHLSLLSADADADESKVILFPFDFC